LGILDNVELFQGHKNIDKWMGSGIARKKYIYRREQTGTHGILKPGKTKDKLIHVLYPELVEGRKASGT